MKTIAISNISDDILLLSLARPEAANALNTAMAEDLLEAWSDLASRAEVRAVILTGQGKAFCAGADLKERNGMSDEAWSRQHHLFEAMIRAQLACPFPIIAAVNGAAMGGGCELALACDFAWASEAARFGLPEAGLGIMPGLGGTQLLTRAVGERLALELLISGRRISAAEAHAYGLVSRVCPADALLSEVQDLARQVAANAPLSVRALKRVVRGGSILPLDQAMELELAEYNRLFTTADRREGVSAYNEKRPPRFEGR